MHFIAVTTHNGQLVSRQFKKNPNETSPQLWKRVEVGINAEFGELPTGREIMVINTNPNALIKHIHSK
jgi:hypothetical protein